MQNHFSSPMLSNWQSAVAKVVTSPTEISAATDRAPLNFSDPLVSAAAFAGHSLQETTAGRATPQPANEHESCAKAALDLAICKIQHDEEGLADAQSRFARFGTCDARWAECIAEFLSHYAVTRHGDVPYRRWKSLNDFVSNSLPTHCKIGVIGDWGTGDLRAQAVLEQVATHKIDILIHIGDIYYSCTTAESNVFYDNMRKVFDRQSPVQIFTLCGNHDMYSGAAPYYALVDRIGQKSSFFCLRNDFWQIVAADTGYNDFNPFDHGGLGSWLQDFDDREAPYSEMLWHADKFKTAGTRRSIFLTHHQAFSRNSAIDGDSAVNKRLLSQLKAYLPQIELWLWGHEHNQVIYKEFMGLKRGRCVGASAIPVPKSEKLYSIDPAIKDKAAPLAADAAQLSVDKASGFYNLGFAIIELSEQAAVESYYELNASTRQEKLLFTSDF